MLPLPSSSPQHMLAFLYLPLQCLVDTCYFGNIDLVKTYPVVWHSRCAMTKIVWRLFAKEICNLYKKINFINKNGFCMQKFFTICIHSFLKEIIYVCLCCVFVDVHGLSLVAANGLFIAVTSLVVGHGLGMRAQ